MKMEVLSFSCHITSMNLQKPRATVDKSVVEAASSDRSSCIILNLFCYGAIMKQNTDKE